MSYGLIWHTFTPEDEDGIAKAFGITKPTVLPTFLNRERFDEVFSDDGSGTHSYTLIPENIILGMLTALIPQEKRMVPIDEDQFIAALKYIATNHYDDENCHEMISFACNFLEQNHTQEDAKMVARVAAQHFGITSKYIGDN